MASRRRLIKPPVPAPYLEGLPRLQEANYRGVPAPEHVAKARVALDKLRELVRKARERWEEENDVQIVPEPPTGDRID